MKQKAKKRMLSFLAAVLTVAVTIGFIPQMAVPAYTASGDSAMSLGTEVLNQNVNSADAQTVWYAGSAWRVIGYQNDTQAQSMRLFAADNLRLAIVFNALTNDENGNDYKDSVLQRIVNQLFEDNFSAVEKHAVNERRLEKDEYSNSSFCTGVSGSETSGYLWPLSTAEANGLAEALRAANDLWWLRSPGRENQVAFVRDTGLIDSVGSKMNANYGVRPAFDLNPGSVLFTSAAEGGKSDTVGALNTVASNSGSEWKLTIRDSDRIGFKAQAVSKTDNGKLNINYSNAKTGDKEYISAIVTDKPITDSAAKIKYYGRIKKCEASGDASGLAEIDISNIGTADTLYVFNEQYNGDKKTDHASDLIKMPGIIEQHTITFKVVNGAWNDGLSADRAVTLFKFDNEDLALVLKAENVPEVGAKPDPNYKEGSWDVIPETDKVVTEDKTYTYTYAANDIPPTPPTPTPEPVAPGPVKVSAAPLLAKITSKGNTSLVIEWNKVEGAEGYDIFFAHCGNDSSYKNVKTIKGSGTTSWTKSGLKKKTSYKTYVKAWVMKNGKKSYVKTSPTVHAYTSGSTRNYTNAKSVTVKKTKVSLKKGKTYKIKASVKKLKSGKKLMPTSHTAKLRYLSTDTKVATVNKSGKITAKGKGTCKVYVYAANGARKAVKVTVK